jgi:hypothetical protein
VDMNFFNYKNGQNNMRHQISKTMTFFNGLFQKVKSVILSTVFALLSVFVVSNQAAAENVTFTVSAPGATEVYLTGPWWGWGSNEAPVATVNVDGTFSLTLDPSESFKYLWVVDGLMESFLDNTVTGTNADGSTYEYIESLVCAPNNDGASYAERVWLVGDGDRADVYDDCSTPAPTELNINFTVAVSGSPAAVKLTGPWWGWDPAGGPEATDNQDGTWTVNLPAVQANLEYLWTSSDGAIDENGDLVFTTESLVDNEANGECGLDGLNVGGEPNVDRYANRRWSYGSEDVTNDVYDACLGTGGSAYPAPPTPADAEVGVISVISTSYTDLEGVNFNPNWSQDTIVVVGEDGVLTYSGLDYQGTEYAAQDVTGYQYLNVDFYTEDSTELSMFVIKSGGGEVGFSLKDSIVLNQWVNVQVPLSHFGDSVDLTAVDQFKVVGNGTVYLTNLYFGGVYDVNADDDNDGVANGDDPLPNNADFSDITQAAFSDAFGGTTIDDGFVYTYPTGSQVWAGIANKNTSLYPITIGDNAVVKFTGSVPSGGSVALNFRFEDQPSPNTNAALTHTSDSVTVVGSTPIAYEVSIDANVTEFNNFLMYLTTPDVGVVIQDVSIGTSAPKQIVSLVGEPKGQIGGQLTLTVDYTTSTGSNVTGLGLNVHYDSAVLTPVSVSDVLQEDIFIAPDVLNVSSDSNNEDNNTATDMLINMAWASFSGADWPGNITEDLLTITFEVVDNDALSSTVIDFSESSTAAGYELSAPAVSVELSAGSWDFDGSGSADALTDGLLLLRYAFGLRGSMLTADATDPSSTLTDSEIEALITTAHGSFADIDASGSTDALTDGLLLLRYLFGLRGNMLVADATDPSAARADGAAVVDYIDSYLP